MDKRVSSYPVITLQTTSSFYSKILFFLCGSFVFMDTEQVLYIHSSAIILGPLTVEVIDIGYVVLL